MQVTRLSGGIYTTAIQLKQKVCMGSIVITGTKDAMMIAFFGRQDIALTNDEVHSV